ncbi:MAG: hypothetical protein H7332_03210 [Bdellovibrionales bacterium]|nr:hypothetical protein [Ramlibacter sp.]
MSGAPRTPPRFVPTLTEVVQNRELAPAPPAVQPAVLQEQIIHRVMQRVDLSLERRLRESVATLVLEQTRSLGPMLREEIESVVRQSVSEAVAEELAQQKQPRRES